MRPREIIHLDLNLFVATMGSEHKDFEGADAGKSEAVKRSVKY